MPSVYPPGPSDWFFGMGQMRQMKADVLGYYLNLHQTYGDIVYTKIGPFHDYVFYHPEQVREVLVSKAKSFLKFSRVRKILARVVGDGLIVSEGDKWLRQRRLVQPAFHAKRFAHYAAVMVERTRRFVERWLKDVAAAGACEVEIAQAMIDLGMEIIAKTMFDAELTGEIAALSKAVAYISETMVWEMESVFGLPDWFPTPHKIRKRRAIRLVDETVRRFIRERRASGQDRGDLLSMLLLAVDEEGTGGMSDEQVRDEAMTLFIAGHDTSAAGLTWLWYNLARCPDIARRVMKEIDDVLAGKPAGAADLPRLRNLEMVLKETLRLQPPSVAVITRQSTVDVEIGGYTLPKGSLVHCFPYVTQRDARWFPDPERFDPERFSPERAEKIPPFAYFPFGGGPHVCIGNNFATMEMTLVAATILQHLQPRLVPGQGDVVPQVHMSLRPKGGLRLKWTARAR
jgi:cytochrome P450